MPKIDVVSVFAAGPAGGNPVPIVPDAAHLTDRLIASGVVDARGPQIQVRQGFAIDRPSQISVRFDDSAPDIGCWIGGAVQRTT